MVYIKKNKETPGKKTTADERKRTPRKTNKNPLKDALSSERPDKRNARKDFFIQKTSDSTSRDDKKTTWGKAGDSPQRKQYNDDNPHRNNNRRDDEKRPYRRNDSKDSDRPSRNNNRNEDEKRPYKRNDSKDSDRPYRNNNRRDDEKRPYKRNDSKDTDRPYRENNRREDTRRPFKRDDNKESDRPYRNNDRRDDEKRPYKRNDNNAYEKPYREKRNNYDDQAPTVRKRRRNVTAESEILTDIVRQRRSEGRVGERKPMILSLNWSEERGPIRLNKYIANSGICSRRDADKLIEAGAVTVNGVVLTELGTKVMPTDEVRYEDKILQREKPVYILLNKPKDFITTTEDEKDRKHVMMLIKDACEERVYPVGRLDRNTTGLLLFTNDGEMAKKLTHPRYGVRKIYHVELNRNLELADFEKIVAGIELSDGPIVPDEVAYVGESKKEIGITIHSGQNRVVRRIFERLGYDIEKLDRVSYAGLTKKDLPRGHWRFLKKEEINILKMSL